MNATLPPLYADARRGLFARLVGNGLAQVTLAIAIALLAQRVIDQPPEASGLAMIAFGLLAAAAALAWLRRCEIVDAEALAQGYLLEVRTALFARLGVFPARALQRRSRGATALRFVGDLNALRLWISQGLARLLVGGLVVVFSLAALAFVDAMLAAAATTVVAIGAAASLLLGGRLHAAARESRRRTARLAANVNDRIAQVQVMQVFGRVRHERRRLARQCRRLRDAMVARAYIRSLARAVAEATAALASAAVLVTGAWLVGHGAATPGALVAALSVTGLLASPLRDLGRAYEFRQSARISQHKLGEFLADPARIREPLASRPLPSARGAVRFEHVGLAGALHDFSAEAAAGARIALVGPNGAGKSTVLQLLLRLAEPECGRIAIDGVDVRALALRDLRAAVSVVAPDLGLLRMSVRDNVRYRAPQAGEDALQRVLTLCGVDEIACALPRGLDTPVRDAGANLSPGQRARIALARALLGGPRLLLLDEAEAYLDPRAGEALDRVLAEFDGTVLMVTHRLERLQRADRVWHLRDGRLVEDGAPTELLQRIGPTSRLFLRGASAATVRRSA